MNGLPDHVQQIILDLKARRGVLENEVGRLSEEIAQRAASKRTKQETISEIARSVFLLESEGKTFPAWKQP